MYPGADGIPVDAHGNPTVCVPDPARGHVRDAVPRPGRREPRWPARARRVDAPTSTAARWTGSSRSTRTRASTVPEQAGGASRRARPKPVPDVMGYKLRADIPNYWAYADNYVLAGPHVRAARQLERARAPRDGVGMVGAAATRRRSDELPQRARQTSTLAPTAAPPTSRGPTSRTCSTRPSVSWAYYVFKGTEPDCDEPRRDRLRPGAAGREDARASGTRCPASTTSATTASSTTSSRSSNLVGAARAGTLPAVSWVDPDALGERAPAGERRATGQDYVTYMINQIMQSPDWDSTAIFLVVGRLGRLLRPRRPADRRRERLRDPRARARDQPVREARATSTTRR